jgi:MerR family redox-sensitive transcriptional activator SoxR
MAKKMLSVGELSRRSGLPVSTLHFYERKGLVASERTSANHRVYRREILRRVTVIKIAQSAGHPACRDRRSARPTAKGHIPRDTGLGAHRQKLA